MTKCIEANGWAFQNDAAYIRIEHDEDLSSWSTTRQIKVKSKNGGVDLTLTASLYTGDTNNRTLEARAAASTLTDLGEYKAWGYVADATGGFHFGPITFPVLEVAF